MGYFSVGNSQEGRSTFPSHLWSAGRVACSHSRWLGHRITNLRTPRLSHGSPQALSVPIRMTYLREGSLGPCSESPQGTREGTGLAESTFEWRKNRTSPKGISKRLTPRPSHASVPSLWNTSWKTISCLQAAAMLVPTGVSALALQEEEMAVEGLLCAKVALE